MIELNPDYASMRNVKQSRNGNKSKVAATK